MNHPITLLLSCLLIGCLNSLSASEIDKAPKLYVERCSFQFKGNNCGVISKNVIYFSSEDFLSFTDNWAVGRKGGYKMYMACLDPGDTNSIDGSLSLITAVVAGPNLKEAYEIAKQLLSEFSAELPEESGNVSHCLEQ